MLCPTSGITRASGGMYEAVALHSCLLLVASRPSRGAGNRRKTPVAETCFFRLTWVLISGRVGLATDRLSPVSTGITARHWRALLFLGCLSPRIENARHEHRAARRECGIRFRFVSSRIFATTAPDVSNDAPKELGRKRRVYHRPPALASLSRSSPQSLTVFY